MWHLPKYFKQTSLSSDNDADEDVGNDDEADSGAVQLLDVEAEAVVKHGEDDGSDGNNDDKTIRDGGITWILGSLNSFGSFKSILSFEMTIRPSDHERQFQFENTIRSQIIRL